MIRVGVLGAAGRMGTEICRAVAAAPDLQLVAAIDPAFAPGHSVPGGGAPEQVRREGQTPSALVQASDLSALADTGTQVVVDFTTAEAARENLPRLAAQGIHAVVGTTGLGEDVPPWLAAAFDGTRANAVIAPNFAIGAVLLMRLAELAAPHMEGVEIVDLHHDAKRDAPSGTALETARRITAARQAAGVGPLPTDPTTDVRLQGARGAVTEGGIHLHAVRLPGLVAHQEVLLGSLGQSLTLRHDSYDRRSFMPGVLLAVRAVASRRGVTAGIEPLLGI